jgi:peptidoglycan hydrolase-like amidase
MKIGGYPEFKKEFVGATGALQSFTGKTLGTCRIVSMWRTPRSWVSSHMFQIEATIDGVTYTGRGAGSGMSWIGKPKAKR